MSAHRIIFSADAEEDIRGIVRYIAEDNPIAARQFEDALRLRLDGLVEFPQIGTPIHHLSAPLRLVRVSQQFRRYGIYYRLLSAQRIRIVRILHSARDIATLL